MKFSLPVALVRDIKGQCLTMMRTQRTKTFILFASILCTFPMLCQTQDGPGDTGFMIRDLTETTLQLNWDHKLNTGIQQYFLYLMDAVTGETRTSTVDAGTAAQTFEEIFTDLHPGTKYILQIDILRDGSSIQEPFIGPDTVYTRPFPPELTLFTQTAEDAVRFEWIPPTMGAFGGYVVMLNDQETIFLDNETLVYEAPGLLPNVEYNFGVYTFAGPSDILNSVWSSLGPTYIVPLAPVDGNVMIESVTSSSLNVVWDDYANAESYVVTLVDVNNQIVDNVTVNGQTAQLSFQGLDPHTFYEARVEVVLDGVPNYAGDSSARTLPVETPSGVVNVQSTTTDTITIEYTEIQDATSYQIIYIDDMGVIRMLTSFGSPSIITDLDPSTVYNVQVNGLVGGQTQLVGTTTGTTNINECASNPCLNGGVCIDRNNGYQCMCPAGLFGGRCTINPNECGSNPCQNEGNCMDEANGFVCDCAAGFSGTVCEMDIDECNSNPTPCPPQSTCQNTNGSFICTCNPGYLRSGSQCTDKNECVNGPHFCVTSTSDCVNTVGDYQCVCKVGYAGSLYYPSRGMKSTCQEISSPPVYLIFLIIIPVLVFAVIVIVLILRCPRKTNFKDKKITGREDGQHPGYVNAGAIADNPQDCFPLEQHSSRSSSIEYGEIHDTPQDSVPNLAYYEVRIFPEPQKQPVISPEN